MPRACGLRSGRGYDALFFHVLAPPSRPGSRAARGGGAGRSAPRRVCLYFDEYVGPSAGEWGIAHELLWNAVSTGSGSRAGCAGRGGVRAPRNDEDPTEIGRLVGDPCRVERRFRSLERRDYGGNLLAPIYPYLRRPSHDPPARARSTTPRSSACSTSRSSCCATPGCRAPPHHTVVLAAAQEAPLGDGAG